MDKRFLATTLLLAACGPSISTSRISTDKSDEYAAKITDEWVLKDTQIAVKDILQKIEEHKGFQRYLGQLGHRPKLFISEVQNETSEPYLPIADINDELLSEFSASGEFVLIDAAARDTILKEIKYQNDGAVDPLQAKQIGKQSGADLLIFGAVRMQPKTLAGKTVKDYTINMRMTDITTGEEVLRVRATISKYSKRSGSGW
jgi:uncharacterized protein (TIGR02722 family)